MPSSVAKYCNLDLLADSKTDRIGKQTCNTEILGCKKEKWEICSKLGENNSEEIVRI